MQSVWIIRRKEKSISFHLGKFAHTRWFKEENEFLTTLEDIKKLTKRDSHSEVQEI